MVGSSTQVVAHPEVMKCGWVWYSDGRAYSNHEKWLDPVIKWGSCQFEI